MYIKKCLGRISPSIFYIQYIMSRCRLNNYVNRSTNGDREHFKQRLEGTETNNTVTKRRLPKDMFNNLIHKVDHDR